MSPHTRRGFLRIGSIALAASAGCVSDPTTRPATLETPPPGECDPRDLPKPDPTDEGLEPASYPSYPRNLDRGAAASFAEAFERAVRRNEFVAANAGAGYDELQVQLGAERTGRREVGYVVGVDGTLLFADERQPDGATGSPYPSGRAPFAAQYLLADRFALREGFDGDLPEDDPDFAGAEVVACAE